MVPWIGKVTNITLDRYLPFVKKAISYLYLRMHGVETRYGYVTLNGFPIIYKLRNSRIILHKGITLTSKSKYNVAGVNHPVILATLKENAIIEIGAFSGLSGTSICSVTRVTVGDGCGLGANTNIYDTDFHLIDPDLRKMQKDVTEAKSIPIRLGKDVWLSANVTVLKGVNIGDGAAVSVGSVVNKNIPSRELHGGIPAKKIKDI